jgi:HK97 family phage prohead protease
MNKIFGNYHKSASGLIEIPKGLYEEKTFSQPAMITDADPSKKTWTAYAAVFGNKDLDDDIIMPGAFKKSIAENGPTGTNTILVLNQHITWQVLCKPKMLQEDSIGLYYEAEVTSGATFAEDAVKLIASGLVEENSIGFQTVKSAIMQPDSQDWETWYRELYELNLAEVSPVTWAANPQARMQGMKKSRTKDELYNRQQKLIKALREPGMRDETYMALELEVKQINTEYYNLGREFHLKSAGAAMLTCPECKAQFEDPSVTALTPEGEKDSVLTGPDEAICPECKCMFTKGTQKAQAEKSLIDGFSFKQQSIINGFNF